MNDESWIRAALPAAVDPAPPRADLAERAERTARRIRRRRFAVAAAAAAVLVAVPVATAGRWSGRAAPDVTTGDSDSDSGCPDSGSPPSAPNLSAGDRVWPYRGAPALEAPADRAAAALGAEYPDVTDTLPLYAARTGDLVLYAVALLRGAHWQLTVGFGDDAGRLPDPVSTTLPYDTQEALLPVLDRDTNLSIILPGPDSNLLLVIAAPGTDRIEFTGCRLGEPVSYAADADTLLVDVGPLDTPGRLTLRTGGQVRYAGPAGLNTGLTPPTFPRVQPPPGYTAVYHRNQAGFDTDIAPALRVDRSAWAGAVLVFRCGGGPAMLQRTEGRPPVRVECDPRVEQRLPMPMTQRPGFPAYPSLYELSPLAEDVRAPFRYDLVLVVPG